MKKRNDKKIIIKEKLFCPLCGSDRIRRLVSGKYKCLLCKVYFSKPKKTKIKLRKRPRYIG